MTLRGTLPQFPLDTVLVLLAETGKSGTLAVRGDEGSGALGLSGGRLVSAEFEGDRGTSALGALFGVLRGGFEFESGDAAGGDLSGELDELLATARAERDRVAQIREVIPNERTRFRLSERAAEGGQIVLTSEQWRALLAADGDRDVSEVAERIGKTRGEAADLLAGLVRMGMIDTVVQAAEERGGGWDGRPLLQGDLAEFPLETIVQLVAATRQTGRIEVRASDAPATIGMSDGHLASAASEDEVGELALANALTARGGEFEFVAAPEMGTDLSGETMELLERAAGARDQLASARELVPSSRSRLSLSDRAGGQEQITLSADQWRALTRIDGRRDVAALASEIRVGRLKTTLLVADLVRGGLVDISPAEPEPEPEPWRAPVTEMPAPPVDLAPPEPVEVAPPEPVEAVQPEPVETAPEPEEPLAETPVDDAAQEAATDDRLAALAGLFGTPEPVEPTPAPADAWTTPAWETPAAEPEAPAEEQAPAEVDPRLAAFAPPEPELPPPPRPEPLPGTMAAPIPKAEPLPGTMGAPMARPAPAPAAPSASSAAAAASAAGAVEQKKKGGLFGFGAKAEAAAPAPTAPAISGPRSAQLARFANELVAAYNSGQYGKAKVEDHMLSLLMRVDEQADPIDRPLPLANDRIDVDSIDRGVIPEQQAVPYLALLVRQIFEDAERALGKDKARKGFKDTRDRIFGKDLALFQAPDVATRLPKV